MGALSPALFSLQFCVAPYNIIPPPVSLSVKVSHLCNCASTRCLQRGKVNGAITDLAVGVERHFQPISLLSLVLLTCPGSDSLLQALFSKHIYDPCCCSAW